MNSQLKFSSRPSRILGTLLGLSLIWSCSAANPQLAGTNPALARSAEDRAACPYAFPQSYYCADLTWVDSPLGDHTGEFILKFWDSRTGTLTDGPYSAPPHSPFVKLWMPSMGHGSSPVVLSQEVDHLGQPVTGHYRAKNAYFVMGGAWEVWVQLRQDKKVVEEDKSDLEL